MTVDYEQRFWSRVNKTNECWEWQAGVTSNGYGVFHIKKIHIYAHRYAYELAFGPVPKGLYICHHCDNPRCVRPDHLWAGTQRENMSDCAHKKRTRNGVFRGEEHPRARLTWPDVRNIRQTHSNRLATPKQLAQQYGVSVDLIYRIVRGHLWKE